MNWELVAQRSRNWSWIGAGVFLHNKLVLHFKHLLCNFRNGDERPGTWTHKPSLLISPIFVGTFSTFIGRSQNLEVPIWTCLHLLMPACTSFCSSYSSCEYLTALWAPTVNLRFLPASFKITWLVPARAPLHAQPCAFSLRHSLPAFLADCAVPPCLYVICHCGAGHCTWWPSL